jgi:hypothetical protein
LARLLWIQALHREGWPWVLWLDADTLVIDADWSPEFPRHTQFGEECWIEADSKGRPRARFQPHNAWLLMHRDSPVRDFLIEAVQSIIARADPRFIAPQMVGPKLLKALHSLVGFDLQPAAGAVSPTLMEALASEGESPVFKAWPKGRPLAVANLCASLPVAQSWRDRLINDPERLKRALNR